MLHRVLSIACLGLVSTSGLQEIKSNDNSTAAGQLEAGVLTVNLTAAQVSGSPRRRKVPDTRSMPSAKKGMASPIPGRCSGFRRVPRSG